MISYPFYDYMLYVPVLSPINMKPPSIYELLNSIVNYEKEETEKKNVTELAEFGRSEIFDFQYPLSNKITKKDFEETILNHFLMRRIGFDTLTAFKIQLKVKLNEIMPMYNKLIDSIDGWNLFTDGEKEHRTVVNNTTLENSSNSESINTSDRRYSDMPQNKLNEIQSGSFITDYNFDNNSNSGQDSSNSAGTSFTEENYNKEPGNKFEIYKQFIENKNNIYSMIFKDLESLFYQLI